MTNDNDPRPSLALAAELAVHVAEATATDTLDRPTPCADLDVAELLDHLHGVLGRIHAMATGRSATGQLETKRLTDTSVLGPAAEAATAAWLDDDALLGATLTAPFGELPGAVVAVIYTSELLTHTWDLAVATGQRVTWPDDETLRAVLGAMQFGLPADRPDDVPFDAPVDVPDDSPLIEQLVAWTGRDPAAWTTM